MLHVWVAAGGGGRRVPVPVRQTASCTRHCSQTGSPLQWALRRPPLHVSPSHPRALTCQPRAARGCEHVSARVAVTDGTGGGGGDACQGAYNYSRPWQCRDARCRAMPLCVYSLLDVRAGRPTTVCPTVASQLIQPRACAITFKAARLARVYTLVAKRWQQAWALALLRTSRAWSLCGVHWKAPAGDRQRTAARAACSAYPARRVVRSLCVRAHRRTRVDKLAVCVYFTHSWAWMRVVHATAMAHDVE